MRKAKIVAFLLTVVCMVCCFASCGGQNDPDFPGHTAEKVEGNDPVDTRSENQATGGQQETTENPDVGGDDRLKIEQSQIFECEGYSEGLAFVNLGNIKSPKWCCIDKDGTVVFTIDDYIPRCEFHNGYAVLRACRDTKTYVLCDRKGIIITAEDLGGNSLVFNETGYNKEQDMFSDGYLLVRKTTTSFTGSTDEMAIFMLQNGQWTKTTDFSVALSNAYSDVFATRGDYYNSFLYHGNQYIDLKTGEVCDDISNLYHSMTLKNKSDFWRYSESAYYFYDDRERLFFNDGYNDPKGTPVIDMSQYKDTIYNGTVGGYDFPSIYSDGTCGIVFRVEDSSVGDRYYFTIMDEEGNFKFEPIETRGQVDWIISDNGTYVLNTYPYIEVYGENGKIAEMNVNVKYDLFLNSSAVQISDGVIIFEDHSDYPNYRVYLHTDNLEPLF